VVEHVHDHDKEKGGERTTLFNARRGGKRLIYASLEVSSKSNFVKEPLNSIAKADGESNVFK
jgi:hypothetical protein